MLRPQGEPAAARIWSSASCSDLDPPPNLFDNPILLYFLMKTKEGFDSWPLTATARSARNCMGGGDLGRMRGIRNHLIPQNPGTRKVRMAPHEL